MALRRQVERHGYAPGQIMLFQLSREDGASAITPMPLSREDGRECELLKLTKNEHDLADTIVKLYGFRYQSWADQTEIFCERMTRRRRAASTA